MDIDDDAKIGINNYLRLIVLAVTDEEREEGWLMLKKLEEQNREVFNNCHNNLRYILNINEPGLNSIQLPQILDFMANYITATDSELNPISNDIAKYITSVKSISTLTAILNVLSKHKVYIPNNICHPKLCESIIFYLASVNPSQQPQEISILRKHVKEIQSFLEMMCEMDQNEEKENLVACLQTLYKIISIPYKSHYPGPCLSIVLQMVDPLLVPKVVSSIFARAQSDKELAQVLRVLCAWLPKWSANQLGRWIMDFVHGLEQEQKYNVLSSVTLDAMDDLFLALKLPMSRLYSSDVVCYILKKYIVVNKSTKQVVPVIIKIRKSITDLKNENSESSKQCIQSLIDIMRLQIEIENNDNSMIAASGKIIEKSNIQPWSNNSKEFECVTEVPRLIGKVGLLNLGNTCYMNSVLQALAMTRQFCHGVLHCKMANESSQIVLQKLQNLFTLLSYSKRNSLSPKEILLASRPSYFLPGQQQDSSEFLCHLLDVLHEQEKSTMASSVNSDVMSNFHSKNEEDITETNLPSENLAGCIKRWTTEEDLTGTVMLKRKAQSLADFTQGDDCTQEQKLSDSHSDSTDSGIQSVGGEDTNLHMSLVHKAFGGVSKITYQCAQCDTSSHNTDKFRDLQLCFPEEITENQEVTVQDLINCYLAPEKLTGENKYRCDKCTKLCDAQRIIKILQAPSHLILTLKHFHYDFDSRLRTKLRHKVSYNDTIQIPVSNSSCSSFECETYQLYAAVVHSGYSMDYGHYFTYACDSKQNWYKFNDSYVSQSTFTDLKNLKPPDTPYILFYEKTSLTEGLCDEEKPILSTLCERLQDLVDKDTIAYLEESRKQYANTKYSSSFFKRNDNSDDENPPPSNCRGAVGIPTNQFLY